VTALEILRAARSKISLSVRWTKHCNASNSDGDPVMASDPVAVCWCALGAVYASSPQNTNVARNFAREALSRTAGTCIVTFNDHATTTHADVLRVFDKTIARLEATP
jgi:hypothetical protein